MSTADKGTGAFNKIEFTRVYGLLVGSIPVVCGEIKRDAETSPRIFAAALSERELRNESCGYGVTEAAAVVSLFEYMR
jgi:hypothetical protein